MITQYYTPQSTSPYPLAASRIPAVQHSLHHTDQETVAYRTHLWSGCPWHGRWVGGTFSDIGTYHVFI